MYSLDIEIARIVTSTTPNRGFYSGLEIISRDRADVNSPAQTNLFKEAQIREALLAEQDDLTEMMGGNPGETGILLDGILDNQEVLREL